jgi:hypothetical protein
MKTRRIKFPGIVRFAKQYRVTRIHCYLVLRGDRKSPRLTKLWNEFQKREGK